MNLTLDDDEKRDLARRAANYVFSSLSTDVEVREIFVELIKEADPEAFKVHLLAIHKRSWDEFEVRHPGEIKRSEEEFEVRHPGEWARRLREAGRC
jgi:hypothetical protein